MKKILEIVNNDWMKGQSAQVSLPIGGLFSSISNYDPFEQGGVFLPSLNPATISLGTIPRFLSSFNSSAVDYLYAHSDTKLYQVLKDSPYTVTDVTNQINQGMGTVNKIYGRIKWKNGYVYAVSDGSLFHIRYNAFPVASGSDVAIKTSGVILETTQDFLAFCVGADGNLYYGNENRVMVLTRADGTTGNDTFYAIDEGYQIRDIVNDGRYLVVIADNNTVPNASRRVGSYQCKIYFWDMVQTAPVPGTSYSRITPTTMWDITDSYMIAGKMLGGNVQIIGYNGIYICTAASEPEMIRPFPKLATSDKLVRPLNPSQVAVTSGSFYWIDGMNTIATTGVYNPDVYAYGNPITGLKKIFYRPYTTGVNKLSTCVLAIGNNIVVGDDTPKLNFFNVGSTRGTASFQTLDTTMDSPHTYEYTKVALNQPLASGQSVQVIAYTQGTNVAISSETKSYSASNPRQTLVFKRIPASTNNPDKFEDLTVSLISVGAQIQRVTTYATPLNDANELV